MNEQISKAVEVLRAGGIILYPTDTVWGIGCDATNADAVEKIYALKRSMGKTSMTVLLDNLDNVGRYVRRVPEIAWQLFEVSDKPLGAVALPPTLFPSRVLSVFVSPSAISATNLSVAWLALWFLPRQILRAIPHL